jgi:1,4-alpha-glucan branching enzyme
MAKEEYLVGVPVSGSYSELLNTDSEKYGGSGLANNALRTTGHSQHGQADSLSLRLPGLATLIIKLNDGN